MKGEDRFRGMKARPRFLGGLVIALSLGACNLGPIFPGPLNMRVWIDRPGAAVMTFRVGIENQGTTKITLEFMDSQFFEIEIMDASGKLLWNWANGMLFYSYAWRIHLLPGTTYAQEARWDLTGNDGIPLPSGIYKARYTITCSPRDNRLVFERSLAI